ncbi:TPA: oligosaccharide flippase family protein, partial [Escherichia coli]|nr:oligosaccharide flippase family protein [Escherichia coli]
MKIRNIIHFVIGLTLSAIINVVTLPVMAWFYPQETIGKIAMLNVMITFSATLFSLGLDQAFVRWYHESDNKTEAFYNSFLPGAGALLCILLCLNIFFPDVILKIIDEDKTAISFMISFLIISGYCNRFLPIIFRMEEKGVLFSLSQLLPKGIFLILICILALSKNNNIELLILSLLFSFSLVTIISVFFAKDLLFPLGKIDIKKIHEMLHYSIPLLIGAISYWGLSSVDRLFIVKYSTYSELAIFSIAISFAGIANVAQSIFSTIWIPTVFKWIHQIKPVEKCYEKIDLVKNLISCVSFFIVSIAGLFGWLLLYLLPYNYANIIYLIPLCMLSI